MAASIPHHPVPSTDLKAGGNGDGADGDFETVD
jgi:hypothetical protein